MFKWFWTIFSLGAPVDTVVKCWVNWRGSLSERVCKIFSEEEAEMWWEPPYLFSEQASCSANHSHFTKICLFSLSIGVLSTESRVTANSNKETFRAPTGRELSFE